jgi:hypothetical protein
LTVNGEKITTPLKKPDNAALVLDARARKELVYIMDINVDAGGNPLILFLTSQHHATGPKGDPRTWKTLHWYQGVWHERDITTSSNNYDWGNGCVADKEQRDEVDTSGAHSQERSQSHLCSPGDTGPRRLPSFLGRWKCRNHIGLKYFMVNKAGKVFQLPRNMRRDWEKPVLQR